MTDVKDIYMPTMNLDRLSPVPSFITGEYLFQFKMLLFDLSTPAKEY